MPTYTFTGPRVRVERKGNCPDCGKKLTRKHTVEKTVNPFNVKVVDGQRIPKTWDEVRADVKAKAEAWDPDPAVFEHEKCRGERTAPPRAEPVPVPPERLALAAKVRAAMAALAGFTERHGLVLGGPDFTTRGSDVAFADVLIPERDLIAWARAFGLTEVKVSAGPDSTHVRITGELPGVTVHGHTWINAPAARDRLGGAPVEWHRDHKGRRIGGTVTVDALAEGLAAMGIAVVDPSLPTCERGDVA